MRRTRVRANRKSPELGGPPKVVGEGDHVQGACQSPGLVGGTWVTWNRPPGVDRFRVVHRGGIWGVASPELVLRREKKSEQSTKDQTLGTHSVWLEGGRSQQVREIGERTEKSQEGAHLGTEVSLESSLVSINHTSVVYVSLRFSEWKILQKMLFGDFPSILFP